MNALIVAGSALFTVLAVAAIAMLVAGSRADRAQGEPSSAPATRARPERPRAAQRLRRAARPRSSAKR
jgi:hypothetical protein